MTEFLIKYKEKSETTFKNVVDEFFKLTISQNCAKYIEEYISLIKESNIIELLEEQI